MRSVVDKARKERRKKEKDQGCKQKVEYRYIVRSAYGVRAKGHDCCEWGDGVLKWSSGQYY